MLVHSRGSALPPAFRDVLGDALWAMMIYWLVAAVTPKTRPVSRAALALAICWLVEFSQLYHTTALDGWRRHTLGQLTLGSGFDPRDLAAYALGVIAALILGGFVDRRYIRLR